MAGLGLGIERFGVTHTSMDEVTSFKPDAGTQILVVPTTYGLSNSLNERKKNQNAETVTADGGGVISPACSPRGSKN